MSIYFKWILSAQQIEAAIDAGVINLASPPADTDTACVTRSKVRRACLANLHLFYLQEGNKVADKLDSTQCMRFLLKMVRCLKRLRLYR